MSDEKTLKTFRITSFEEGDVETHVVELDKDGKPIKSLDAVKREIPARDIS